MSKQSWKFVSVWNCIKIIFFALLATAIVFIPVTINGVSISTYKILPIIGDGSFFSTFITENLAQSIGALIPGFSDFALISTIYTIFTYTFFAGIILDVIFALLLIITRSNAIRILIRLISVILGFAMLIIGLLYLLYVIAIIYGAILNGTFNQIINTGILFALGVNVVALILCKKQFKWFKKPFPRVCYKQKNK